MKAFPGFVLILLGVWQSGFSQGILSGVVHDDLGVPLEHVGLLLVADPDSVLVSRAYSNDAGEFSLILSKYGAFTLVFQRMAYRSESVRIIFREGDPRDLEPIKVILREIPFHLPEVVVNAEKPMRISKDTVAIKVSNYLSGHERVVEDVLRQLPGVEVASDGSIRVRGKIVSRVLIEGDDLFYQRYPMLTRNLNADLLDEVQVLYHYSENPLLKDLQDSQAVALNIKLKPEVKGAWVGSSEIGLGMPENYILRPNLIRVRKATKSYVFGNANNTGVDVQGELPMAGLGAPGSGQSYVGDQETLEDFISSQPAWSEGEGNRSNFKAAELTSFSGVFNPIPNLRMKAQANYIREKNRRWDAHLESFTADTLQFQNSLIKQTESSIRDINYHFSMQYMPKGHFLEGHVQGGESGFKSSDFVQLNQISNTNLNFNDRSKNDSRISYTRKIKNRTAFQCTLRSLRQSQSGKMQLDSIPYGLLGFTGTSVGKLEQTLAQAFQFKGAEVGWLGKFGNASWRAYSQWSLRESVLSSSLGTSDSAVNNVMGSTFENQIRSRRIQSGLGLNFTVIEKPWRVQAQLSYQPYLRTVWDSIRYDVRGFPLVPLLAVDWNASGGGHAAFAQYAYQVTETGMSDWLRKYLLTDFRSLATGGGYYNPYRSHHWLGGYTLGAWGDVFQLNASLQYQREPKYLGQQLQYNTDFMKSASLEYYRRERITFNMQADQYFESLSGNFKGKCSLGQNQYEITLNGLKYPMSTSQFEVGAEWKSILDGGVNYHMGYTWTWFATMGQNRAAQRVRNAFFDLDLRFRSKLFFRWSNVWNAMFLDSSRPHRVLSDLSLRFLPKSGRTELNFQINNLWNVEILETKTLSEAGYTQFHTRIRPRSALVSVDFKF